MTIAEHTKIEITMQYVKGLHCYDEYVPNDDAMRQYIAVNGVSYCSEGVQIDGMPWRWVGVSMGVVSQRDGIWYTITLGFWSTKLKTWHHHQFEYTAADVDELRWWEF